MHTDVPQFTIIRSKWSKGLKAKTKILDDFGNRDCLGFYMQACSFEDKDLVNVDEPIDMIKNHEWFTKLLEWHGMSCIQSPVCFQIIEANDHPTMEQNYREQRLKDLFASIDITVNFIDEPFET